MFTDYVATKPAKEFTLADIKALLSDDFAVLDALILQSLHSQVELIQEIGQYIINSGGKRLRPLLVVLVAKAYGYTGKQHVEYAAIIEFLHTATLLHDDVVDASTLRRGTKTANAIWGNEASVLVGDFLYSRAFQMMNHSQDLRIIQVLANATNTIAEGEVLQLINRNDATVSEQRYMNVIHCKTAVLFSAATQLGAIAAEQSAEQQQVAAAFGLHLGMAFQIIDDVLDYTSSSATLGKNIGDDLAEGKITLPLIYAMQHGNPSQRQLIQTSIEKGGLENLASIMQAIEETQAFDYARKVAHQQEEQARQALERFPTSPYQQALSALTEFAVQRKF